MRGLLIAALLIIGSQVSFAASTHELAPGAGRYQFDDPATGKVVTVYYYKPSDYTPNTPIVFVMHGLRRDAANYRNSWSDYAEQNGLMVLVPLFKRDPYRGANGYNMGNVFHAVTHREAIGRAKPESLNPKKLWAFTLIERLFADFLGNRADNTHETYYLYGHGAGAQFTHRFMLFMPDAHVEQAIVANSGWYTMPDRSIEWPYGIGGVPIVGPSMLKAFYGSPMLLLSGGADRKTYSTVMRQNQYTRPQGPTRVARAKNYYENGRRQAAKLGVPFNWHIWVVPGVGHSDDQMAPVAARYISLMAGQH